MAHFKFLGVLPPEGITWGPWIKFVFPTKEGKLELTPVPPATEFVVGQDIGYDLTEARVLRSIRADPRFEEIP